MKILHYILQVFCVHQEDGGGVNRGSDIVKAKSSGEDPRATGGLVSNLPHPRVNKTKQNFTAETISKVGSRFHFTHEIAQQLFKIFIRLPMFDCNRAICVLLRGQI